MTTYAEALAEVAAFRARVVAAAPSSTWSDLLGVPRGWREIVLDFARGVEASGVRVNVIQAKEKVGGLRLYYETQAPPFGCHPRVDALVDAAEDRASATCETCGRVGVYRNTPGWPRVLCDACATELGR